MNTITLCINKDEDSYDVYEKFRFIEGIEEFEFDLRIDVYNGDTFNYLISSYGDIKENIYDYYKYIKNDKTKSEEEKKRSLDFCKKYLNLDNSKFAKILNNIEYVYIEGNYSDINNFINNNKELLKKKIIINKEIGYSKEEIKEIEDSFDSTENIYVISEGNKEPISFSDYKKTNDIIEGIVERVKQYNFSPLEQLLYVYDIVRDKVYKVEPEGENYRLSRDLTKSLLGDYRVCEGFARIFNAIIEKLDFRTNVIIVNDNNSEYAHARNLVYVKDEKYNIDGLYHFDTTADCKKAENGNSHFNQYKYFAKTKIQIKALDKSSNRDLDDDYVINEDTIERVSSINIANNSILSGQFDYSLIKVINSNSKLVDNKTIIDGIYVTEPKSELLSDLNRYMDMHKRPIDPMVFIRAFYTVRKQEYYDNPDKFPLSLDIIKTVLSKSGFIRPISNGTRLLYSIFNKEVSDPYEEVLTKFNSDGIIEHDIQGVKLTKVLRKIYESKK